MSETPIDQVLSNLAITLAVVLTVLVYGETIYTQATITPLRTFALFISAFTTGVITGLWYIRKRLQ